MTALPTTIPAAAPPQTGRRMTRDDVLALARQGRVWEFIPLGLRLLTQYPDDHALRVVVATSYARLGLGTAAVEQLAVLPASVRADQAVVALERVLPTLVRDEIPVADRLARCDANLTVLAGRGMDLAAERRAWGERTAGERWYATRDGNLTKRSTGASPDEPWLHFRNDRAEAEAFAFPHLAGGAARVMPYVLEGIDPPWMLMKLYATTPMAKDGARTRISVVQEGADELLDGLACVDLRSMLGDDRVHLFVGDGAGERLLADLRGRFGVRVMGPAVSLATVRRRSTPPVGEIVQRAGNEQEAESRRLRGAIEGIYGARDRAWWHARYMQEREPLRVLIPTCRYSTFVKHSSADLAEGFRAIGWEARVLIEPDDQSHFSSVAYQREIESFRPDLVVLINYPRLSVGDFFPASLPYVCWIQDAMPHQFDSALGARQGAFDFLAGYLHWEMFEQNGFPRERAMLAPVVVSPRKFHAGPVGAGLEERMACEMAYVSHHSETPEAMHARLVQEAGAKEPLAARIFEALRPEIERIARRSMSGEGTQDLRAVARDAARRVLGSEAPETTSTLVVRQYCVPMADRWLRHETLEWAARIAQRRGWRLHLYGRGWESHPTLRAHAKGELPHDELLRASYRTARVHLHASSNWLLHQRVMECALSGGLALSRLKATDLAQWEYSLLHSLANSAPIVMERKNSQQYREYGYVISDHAESMMYAAQLQRLGLAPAIERWMHGRRYEELRRMPGEMAEPAGGWVLGELTETTFRDEAELEGLVTRAVEDDAWRERTAAMVASRTRARYTTDSLASRLGSMVCTEMGRVETPAGEA